MGLLWVFCPLLVWVGLIHVRDLGHLKKKVAGTKGEGKTRKGTFAAFFNFLVSTDILITN